MVLISELSMCMSRFNRRNQLLCWYTDGINLCTEICGIADKIEECKRRNIKYGRGLVREFVVGQDYTPFELTMTGYNIHKIYIYKSLEAFDKKLHNLHGPSCVPALTKKLLAAWAVTTFNRYQELDDRNSSSYVVWIQPEREVPLNIPVSMEELEDDVRTHWVSH